MKKINFILIFIGIFILINFLSLYLTIYYYKNFILDVYIVGSDFRDGDNIGYIGEQKEDLNIAINRKTHKWGYLENSYKVKIPFKFDNARDFSEGLAAVKNSSVKWGYIDKKGKLIVDYQYDDASNFKNGVANVKKGKKEYKIYNPYKLNECKS